MMNTSNVDDQLEDMFDRLPDEIVRTIFNKLHDARSLCSSIAVCKRFQSIAPQVNHIYLPIPQKKPVTKEPDHESKSFFKNIVTKTLHFVSQMIKFKSRHDDDSDGASYHVPNEVLKRFEEVQSLHLRLPCHHGNINPKLSYNNSQSRKNSKTNLTTFLKWKAEFGQELHSCVMLGAKARIKYETKRADISSEQQQQSSSVVMTEDDLKLRIVWTISCLIAASARHFLIQETVKSHKMIESVVVSDESDQGELCMDKEQVEEMKKGFKGKKGSDDHEGLEYRSKVPALKMKMWYLERLVLPSTGEVLEGATLVVIRPAGGEEGTEKSEAKLVETTTFGGEVVLGEAARKLMVAKRCYTLEMNSF